MSSTPETDRIYTILDSCRDDAKEQLSVLQAMIDNGDPRDIKAMVVLVMAAENTLATVRKLCSLSLCGGGHGLARSAA